MADNEQIDRRTALESDYDVTLMGVVAACARMAGSCPPLDAGSKTSSANR